MDLNQAEIQLIYDYRNYTTTDLRGVLKSLRDGSLHLSPYPEANKALEAEIKHVMYLRMYIKRNRIVLVELQNRAET